MIRLDRHVLAQIVMQQMTPTEAVVRASVAIEGDASTLPELFDLLDEFRLMFPVRAAPPILLVRRPGGAKIPRGMACRKGRR
jgi:alkyl sulfatase BDS1-like metallo-beta-lactamase superfamily hydrolase